MEQILIVFVNLFKWTFITSMYSSMIALLILFVRVIFKQRIHPKWYVWLWVVLILRLILPWAPESSFSLFNVVPLFSSYVEVDLQLPSIFNQPQHVSNSFDENLTLFDTDDSFNSLSPRYLWLLIFPIVWAVGVLTVGIRLYRQSRRIDTQLTESVVINDPTIISILETCKQRLKIKANIAIMHNSVLTSPTLYGLLRPRLIMPKQQLKTLNSDHLEYIMMHELGHYKHRDIGINWLMAIILTFHWFNPLLRYCYVCMREDQELASDCVALTHLGEGQVRDYGYAMIEMLKSPMQAPNVAGTAHFISSKAQLGRRLTMIRSFRKESRWRFVLGLSLVFILASLSLSNAKIMSKSVAEFSIPEGWEAVQSGHEIIYVPPGLPSSNGQVSISVVDYMSIETNGYDIPQIRIYDETQDLQSWLEGIQRHFSNFGVELVQEMDSEIGPVLVQRNQDYLNVTFYNDGPRPFAVSITSTGMFSEEEVLKREGYYRIFRQIVTNASSGVSS